MNPQAGTRVDITGGTIPMTLAVKRAAQLEGHRIAYCAQQVMSRDTTHWLGWVDVTESAPWRAPRCS